MLVSWLTVGLNLEDLKKDKGLEIENTSSEGAIWTFSLYVPLRLPIARLLTWVALKCPTIKCSYHRLHPSSYPHAFSAYRLHHHPTRLTFNRGPLRMFGRQTIIQLASQLTIDAIESLHAMPPRPCHPSLVLVTIARLDWPMSGPVRVRTMFE